MIRETIEIVLAELRNTICEEIRKELKASGPVEVHIEMPCDTNKDRFHTTTITKISLDENNNVMVTSTNNLNGEEVSDDLMLYSVDEMLKIVNEI